MSLYTTSIILFPNLKTVIETDCLSEALSQWGLPCLSALFSIPIVVHRLKQELLIPGLMEGEGQTALTNPSNWQLDTEQGGRTFFYERKQSELSIVAMSSNHSECGVGVLWECQFKQIS